MMMAQGEALTVTENMGMRNQDKEYSCARRQKKAPMLWEVIIELRGKEKKEGV